MEKYTEANTSKKSYKKEAEKKQRRPVLPVIITLLLAGSIGIQGYQVYTSRRVTDYVADQQKKEAEALEQSNTYQEDGFKVGEQYEIKSTKQISDAYISGDESGLSKEDAETLKMAKEVLDSEIKDGMTDFEKEEAIYKWMVKNIGQGQSTTVSLPSQRGGDDYTPHGVLKSRNAVCVGYATTFRLFMNMLGMDCHIVHNDYHSWDLVQLDDGKWYHTDVYSDAGSGPSYKNFNMNDASAMQGHDWDTSALPAADGVKYTAANQKKVHLKSIEEVPDNLKKGFDKDERVFYYEFDKVTEDDYPAADYIVTQLQSAFTASGMDAYVGGMWYDNEDESKGYILGLYVETYEDTGMSEKAQSLSEKDQTSITDAINAAFGTEIPKDPYDFGGVEGMGEEYDETTYSPEAEVGDMAKEPDMTQDYLPSETIEGKDKTEKKDYHYYADEDGE